MPDASTTVPVRLGAWPDGIDAAATVAYLALIVAATGAGYFFLVADFRAYLRRLRRALVVVGSYFTDVPHWSRPYTPPCILALGLRLPCSEEDLLHAYRTQVKRLHPDRGGDRRRFLRLQIQFEQALQYLRSASDD